MIKITGSQPKQMTVFFGEGSVLIGQLECREHNLVGVSLIDSDVPHAIGENGKTPLIQDGPAKTNNLARRSVILSYPVSQEGVHSIGVLIQALKAVRTDIFNKLEE